MYTMNLYVLKGINEESENWIFLFLHSKLCPLSCFPVFSWLSGYLFYLE